VKRTPQWKVVAALTGGDIFYLALLLGFFRLAKDSQIAWPILRWLPIFYFVVPMTLSVMGLAALGQLSRTKLLKTISLLAWAVVLPILLVAILISALMGACHINLFSCQPY